MLFDEGPRACPFIALETDRDRRSTAPDSRHRCYAEPVPAPRALAHQTAFCLSPDFAGCPIFRDWAVRAAAQPVALAPDGAPEQIELLPQPVPSAGVASDAHSEPGLAEVGAADVDEPRAMMAESTPEEPTATEMGAAQGPAEEPPLPAFLAGRPERPDRPFMRRFDPAPIEPQPSPPSVEPLTSPRSIGREDLIPSWERDRDFATRADGRFTNLLSRATTALIILAIVALIGLAIILAPGLLGGQHQPTQPAVIGSPSPSVNQSVEPTFTPEPTIEPQPSADLQTYTIKPGDNLTAIARRFGLTIEQLLAANPEITDANDIFAGQVINIPPDDFGLPTPTPAP
jgi:nucleoid-associated protein YgaU